MKHVIAAWVENQPGVLAGIVGLISGRGYNIETLNVAPTQDSAVSRMTMTVPGDDRVLAQVTKQLNKMVDVIKVTDLTAQSYTNRELVLVEIGCPESRRAELGELAGRFGAEIVSSQPNSLTIQLAAEGERIEEFVKVLAPFRILDLSRTGVIAVARGE